MNLAIHRAESIKIQRLNVGTFVSEKDFTMHRQLRELN
jgi:hypothetical protein